MPLTGTRTFVGFGFGAIQSGLFLYEAFHSGEFRRLVVVEVMPEMVAAVKQEGGYFCVNIAHHDRVESARVGPVDVYDPNVEVDRLDVLAAIIEAEEIATAVPSVAFYVSEKVGSIHRLLADGLCQKIEQDGPRAVVYAAENHNHAAEILEAAVMDLIPQEQRAAVCSRVRFLNTVIGKMSQVVADPLEVRSRNLPPITSDLLRAFLVEAFNRILISKVQFPESFERGIHVFQEKDDLLPFEEAKLYGHNATHALLGYLGAMLGAQSVADLQEVPGMLPFARAAFIEESGAALIRKHNGIDQLFTQEGYRDFADDLLERMTNPFLVDTIDRVTRDTERKLGWNDRLTGTMRVALVQGVAPRRYALGAAAALVRFDPAILENQSQVGRILDTLWQEASPDQAERNRLVTLIESALAELRSWHAAGFPNLEIFYNQIQ
jgi:mannitol-1-phosphate 5-dehydrogenase